jgi:phosphohistidine phosphatase
MKTLILLRHAKSSWKHEGLADHDRPLNKRGERDAPRAGEALRERHLVPDLMYSSSAERALKTAEQAALAMDFEGDIAVDRRLYLASPEVMLEFVREISEQSERVLIVGHNPGMEEFVAAMVGAVAPMPTAALAVLALDVNAWAEASFERGATLQQTWRPKDERRE